jgi:hypothetical protein
MRIRFCRDIVLNKIHITSVRHILLLLVFFIPWTWLGLYQYEIYIKEISVIFVFLFMFFKNIYNKENLIIDSSGRIYILFLLVCIFYYFIELLSLDSVDDRSFLTHVLLSTILNFVIYFIFINTKENKINLKLLIKILILMYFSIFIFFVVHSLEVHTLSKDLPGGYFTFENLLQQSGMYNNYFGGNNGRSWFFLILTSFFVGYFISKNRFFYAFIFILSSLIVSYLLMSRGAMLFGIMLFILFALRSMLTKTLSFNLGLYTFILLLFFGSNYADFNSLELLQKKTGFSNRDFLVFESINLIFNDYLLGRGFHSLVLDGSDFLKMNFVYLSNTRPQNTFLSIFIELGVFGVFFYFLFWVTLFISFGNSIKLSRNSVEKHYLYGSRYMIIWIIFSFIFVHFFEKSFVATPIYMLIIGTAVSIKLYKRKIS